MLPRDCQFLSHALTNRFFFFRFQGRRKNNSIKAKSLADILRGYARNAEHLPRPDKEFGWTGSSHESKHFLKYNLYYCLTFKLIVFAFDCYIMCSRDCYIEVESYKKAIRGIPVDEPHLLLAKHLLDKTLRELKLGYFCLATLYIVFLVGFLRLCKRFIKYYNAYLHRNCTCQSILKMKFRNTIY